MRVLGPRVSPGLLQGNITWAHCLALDRSGTCG